MQTPTTVFSHCRVCQRKLEHTTLFCHRCQTAACSWECYVRHAAVHAQEGTPTRSAPARDGRRDYAAHAHR